MSFHDHYDAERDKRWACVVTPCLTPEVAPMPGLAVESAELQDTVASLRARRLPDDAALPRVTELSPRDLFDRVVTLGARVVTLETALRSIAANTCCGPCQEAALVAKQALAPGVG